MVTRAIFVLFSPSPRFLDHFHGLYPGFLVFTSYQIPSHLVYRDPSRLTANIYEYSLTKSTTLLTEKSQCILCY